MDQTGKLLPEGRICWSEAPQEVVIQKPYVIGLLPRYVEVLTSFSKAKTLHQFYDTCLLASLVIEICVSNFRFDLFEFLIP